MPLISIGDNTANAFSLFNSSNAFRACDVETKHTPHSPICKSAINVFTGTDHPSCNQLSCFESGGLRVFFAAVHPFCGATGVGFGAVCFLNDGGVTALVACVEFEIAGVATFDNSDVNAPDRSKSNNYGISRRSCFDTARGRRPRDGAGRRNRR